MLELKSPSGRLVITLTGSAPLDGNDQEWMAFHLARPKWINQRLAETAPPIRSTTEPDRADVRPDEKEQA